VGGAERSSGVPHFESKGRIEHRIGELGLPATVLRPAFFISNFAFVGPTPTDDGLLLTLALKPETKLQMIAPEDIGLFAADAFENPDEYLGRRLEIASDELTGPDMAGVFERVSGLRTRFQKQHLEQLRQFDAETATMFDWLTRPASARTFTRCGLLDPRDDAEAGLARDPFRSAAVPAATRATPLGCARIAGQRKSERRPGYDPVGVPEQPSGSVLNQRSALSTGCSASESSELSPRCRY